MTMIGYIVVGILAIAVVVILVLVCKVANGETVLARNRQTIDYLRGLKEKGELTTEIYNREVALLNKDRKSLGFKPFPLAEET